MVVKHDTFQRDPDQHNLPSYLFLLFGHYKNYLSQNPLGLSGMAFERHAELWNQISLSYKNISKNL